MTSASNLHQLNLALTRGAEKETFVFPKGPSGKVKLAPKRPRAPADTKEVCQCYTYWPLTVTNRMQNTQPPKKSTATKKATEKAKAPAKKAPASKTKATEKAPTTKKPSASTKKAATTTKKAATVKKPTKKTTSAKSDTKKVSLLFPFWRRVLTHFVKVAVKAAAAKAKTKSASKTTKTASAKAKPRSRGSAKPASRKVWIFLSSGLPNGSLSLY